MPTPTLADAKKSVGEFLLIKPDRIFAAPPEQPEKEVAEAKPVQTQKLGHWGPSQLCTQIVSEKIELGTNPSRLEKRACLESGGSCRWPCLESGRPQHHGQVAPQEQGVQASEEADARSIMCKISQATAHP